MSPITDTTRQALCAPTSPIIVHQRPPLLILKIPLVDQGDSLVTDFARNGEILFAA